ncbi:MULTISPECIES: TonB-dependent siderophore receptor [Methylorubrum]|uniref:TonB-dependent siderophore receptor n=1 Tax=Methylorubrum TaxID=2282523 RepID=UPI00209D8332|nr:MULTISPECIES: TonB-dependent receptor [Methylorubrum]MCP1547324.1 iron complex outermembrane receptor protein [Methylorubrum zatmanii]MCP1556060.1 iron complex outermembrane receptor protein [Methylorubrum extorquens]MCP1577627.1 iron complex outermembrane receptor protein [Methylorubrum extorquens]
MAGLPVIVALVASVGPAQAGLDTQIDFNMPAGDLARTLVAISRQGGIMISFPPEIAAGRRAIAVQGRLTVREALAVVLAGTGLRMVPGSGGGVTVIADTGTSPSAAAAGLGDIAAIDVTDEGTLSRFGDTGFQAGTAGDTVRLAGAEAKEIPIKIDAVTSNVIRSQVVTSTLDAAQNISGVTLGASDPTNPTFTIRGFQGGAVTVNGMGAAGYGNTGTAAVPIDDVERVEVLKGPTSILTGATANGGVINIAAKQPTSREIRDVVVRYGSFNFKTLAVDLGGPLAGTEGLTYRFNLAGTHADSNYAGYRDRYETLISPVVRWEGADTSILAGLRHVELRRLTPQFTFLDFAGSPLRPAVRIPRGTPYINRDLGARNTNTTVYSDFTHRFGDILGFDTTINNKFNYDVFSDDVNTFTWLRRREPTGSRTNYAARQIFNSFAGTRLINRSDITLTYDAGFAKQTSTFGLDYQSTEFKSSNNVSPIIGINPNNGLPQQGLFREYPLSPGNYTNNESKQVGYYYLEKFDTLDNRLHIFGQVRYDQARYDSWFGLSGRRDVDVSRIEGLSWVSGAAFDVTPYFTVWGNRSNGFRPQLGQLGTTGQAAPPEDRDQWEVGGRFFLFDKKLSVTTSYSDIAATNVARCDPVRGCNFVELISGQNSRAFELDVQGEIFPGLNLIGSFSSVISKSPNNSGFLIQLDGVPQYTGSVWGTYAFQGGLFQGLTVGLGGRGNSNSLVYLSGIGGPSFEVPGYVTANALIGYDFDRWSVQLRANNIFDKYHYLTSYSANFVGIGEGRTFTLQARYSFE